MIKLFSYLDQYKLYSITSQLFDELPEHATSGSEGSGDRRFMDDRAFGRLEKKIEELGSLITIDGSTVDERTEGLKEATFVKVTGTVIFNDMRKVSDLFARINQLGEALTYVTTHTQRVERIEEIHRQLADIPQNNRTKLQELRHELKTLQDIKRLAQEQNLHFDTAFMENVRYVLEYAYKDEFEVQMRLDLAGGESVLFDALLDKRYLLESEAVLLRKYSRSSEKPFTLFGVVTQGYGPVPTSEDVGSGALGVSSANQMRGFLYDMIRRMNIVDRAFTGRLQNEVVIDPIALYRAV